MLKLNYDERYDILYILLADGKNSIGDEEYDGLVVMRNEETGKITGITIFGFSQKYQNDALPLLPDEVRIDFDTDVMPHLSLQHQA